MNIESIKQCIEKIEKELVELKVYVNEIKFEKTPNQLRAELIEKAKSFVEIKSSYLKDSTECYGGFSAKMRENPNYCTFVMNCIFIVNAEKRTVVAILKYLNNSIIKKSIAKCNPSDVFNEHIGKAIALGRALGLDVSEFEQVVQPNKPEIGMIVETKHYSGSVMGILKVESVKPYENDHNNLYPHNEYVLNSMTCFGFGNGDKIINDTNAIYGGVE